MVDAPARGCPPFFWATKQRFKQPLNFSAVHLDETSPLLQGALGLTPLKRSHYTGAGLTPNPSATGELNAAGRSHRSRVGSAGPLDGGV
jgi:hypothetical protein